MSLPAPLPDNPKRWEGWRHYNSENLYERLCLAFDSNPSPEQIEDNCRQLLVWWQKKLPLKNQPSNPLAQMLRAGLDEAPKFLAEARTLLLDNDARARIDFELHERIVAKALDEFKKLLSFAMAENKLRAEDEQRLYERGRSYGLGHDDMKRAIDAELTRLGGERIAVQVAPPPPPPAVEPVLAAAPAPPVRVEVASSGNPADEFLRMLRLSKLCLDGDDMTDDQRDAMCNMGESLGLTGGEAEDLIDEYLEACSNSPVPAAAPTTRTAVAIAPRHAATAKRPTPATTSSPSSTPKVETPAPKPVVGPVGVNTTPLARAGERIKHPSFKNSLGIELFLVTSGQFEMGSTLGEAGQHEQPTCPTTVSCFFMARFPVTNAQFEAFDPTHITRRAPWADERHPVVYVSSRDGEKFCQWLSSRDGRKYRLPTEAEWEYAARGVDGAVFPWGPKLDAGYYANFADRRSTFAWRDSDIDDGFAETAPVGSYPRGASPFGIEDLAGNVFEWCLDFFEPYKGKARVNPRGPTTGPNRIYRGGSWKSRSGNLRASARNFNQPDYFSNDVGFRVVCECED